ncbi:MAG: M48 family metalloprotease [Acidobacteria bacterium]|nr:M48 family metalloprotease [Acidobacteriota bacterium]MBK8811031.1 M48 family metalloprotease [Acidobacteriota bacterium]
MISLPKASRQTLFFAFLVLPLILSICSANIVFGQEDKKKDEQKKQEKLSKAEQEALKKQEKREKRYQKILTYSKEKYDTDPDFKDVVDDKYRTIRRTHTLTAYDVNMRASNVKLVSKENEKLVFDNTLYDNPLAQDFVNRVGQSLIPPDTKRLYSFKIIQNPVPEARALSTGTVYISTGYLALIDNEAQLAYILAHEIAHVEGDDWFEDSLVDVGTVPYIEKKAWVTIVRVVGALGGANQQIISASLLKMYGFNDAFSWEDFQEDDADVEAMKSMLRRNYDVREIQKLYERMRMIASDPRSQTGFIADPDRIKGRLEMFGSTYQQYSRAGTTSGASIDAKITDRNQNASTMRGIARILNEQLAPEIKKKLEDGEMLASSAEFQSTMALVKRDNGIRALQFDLFEMARANLSDSIGIRSNDPLAYYYYGKALKQTARNSSEISKALESLTNSIALDKRQTIAEPFLFRAMLRLADRNPIEAPLIFDDLKTYVAVYQRENAGALPSNMDFIYDFMQDLGVMDYRATPTANTTEAPKPIVGTRPTSTSSVADTSPTQNNVVVTSTVPTPTPTPVKGPKKPVKKP